MYVCKFVFIYIYNLWKNIIIMYWPKEAKKVLLVQELSYGRMSMVSL